MPARPHGSGLVAPAARQVQPRGVEIAGGPFLMGDQPGDGYPADRELPVHEVRLAPFAIDATATTVEEFDRFVQATGYRTDAESFGFSAVFWSHVESEPDEVIGPIPGTPWWVGVRGADWRRPRGSRGGDAGADHPVVHVSHNDAVAYCRWAGRQLPSEAQWECAARGGPVGRRFPWGDELEQDDQHHANVWQGDFPRHDTAADGWSGTAPVRTYRPNEAGLFEVVGNVWEWCSDWFSRTYYTVSPVHDPPGSAAGTARVLRGGSFLCHASYCRRYRLSARSSSTPDSSAGNVGFRTVSAT